VGRSVNVSERRLLSDGDTFWRSKASDWALRAAWAVVVALIALSGSPAFAQQPPAVNKVTAIAKPSRYDGNCPASIEFIATIVVNYPATVSYRWERSDHATGPVQTVNIRSAGQGVVTRWQLSRQIGEVFSGWQRLHVLSPGDSYSNEANFTLICR
jgi:hypothetical protein